MKMSDLKNGDRVLWFNSGNGETATGTIKCETYVLWDGQEHDQPVMGWDLEFLQKLSKEDDSVKWNPYNKVVQSHREGTVDWRKTAEYLQEKLEKAGIILD